MLQPGITCNPIVHCRQFEIDNNTICCGLETELIVFEFTFLDDERLILFKANVASDLVPVLLECCANATTWDSLLLRLHSGTALNMAINQFQIEFDNWTGGMMRG